MLKLKLIEEWKDAKRWFSIHAMLWASVVQIVWAELPEDLKSYLPSKYVSILTVTLLVLGIGGRLVNQETNKTQLTKDKQNENICV